MARKLKIGVSACLLGNKVRYDGKQKRNRAVTMLGRRFTLVPVCPEVEAGLSIPRAPMHLVGREAAPRLIVAGSGIDLSGALNTWAKKRVRKIEQEQLCGVILKRRSPSCAIDDAELFSAAGSRSGTTAGLFTAALRTQGPDLPLIDEDSLADPGQRENFLERVQVYKRWRTYMKKPSVDALVKFHSEHKLQLMAHSPKQYAILGWLVARAKGRPVREVSRGYSALLMEGLQHAATPGKHSNVLMHMMGYFKDRFSTAEKREMLRAIDRFRRGRVGRNIPLTRLRRAVRKYGEPSLEQQTYLHMTQAR